MGVIIGVGLGCLEASFLIVWHQLRALLSDWTRAGLAGALLALCVVLGPHDGSALAFWAGVALVPWRFAHRPSWERCVGCWARPAWRRWRVYDYHWDDLIEACHFVRVRRFRPDVRPVIVSLKTRRPAGFPESSTDSLVIRTERTVEDFALVADDFAHVLGARSCRAYRHPRVRGVIRKHAAVRLELGFGADPLERTVPAFPIPERAEDVDLEAVPVGLTEHGEVWTVPLQGSHLLVAGVMGSGKGSVLWSIVRALLPCILAGTVRLWGWDPKLGAELNIGHDPHDLFYRYVDGDDMQEHADMLSEAVTAMHDQLRWIKSQGLRKLEVPTVEHPLNVLLVDELAQITAKQTDTKLTKQIDNALRWLINGGRAAGFPLVGMLQNPTMETMKHRDELANAVALRLKGGSTRVDMVLPPGSYEAGARCDLIDPGLPGVGFYCEPGNPEPVRVRASWIRDEDIREMARDYAPLPAQAD